MGQPARRLASGKGMGEGLPDPFGWGGGRISSSSPALRGLELGSPSTWQYPFSCGRCALPYLERYPSFLRQKVGVRSVFSPSF